MSDSLESSTGAGATNYSPYSPFEKAPSLQQSFPNACGEISNMVAQQVYVRQGELSISIPWVNAAGERQLFRDERNDREISPHRKELSADMEKHGFNEDGYYVIMLYYIMYIQTTISYYIILYSIGVYYCSIFYYI